MNQHYDHWLELEGSFEIVGCVQEKDAHWIQTTDSIFYVEGGGMAKDSGTLNGFEVEDIRYENHLYWHKIHGETSGIAKMKVDREQRIEKVQVHSASHLICGHINHKYGAQTIAFFTHEDTSGCEMEFETFDEELMRQIEREVNEYVLEDLPIEIVYPTVEEAKKHVQDEKLDHEELRAAVIGDIDYNMCGCIHVPSLRYLQSVKLLSFEKTTRGYKIYFVCGEQLLRTYTHQLSVLEKCAKELGTAQKDTYEGLMKVRSDMKELKNSETAWKQKVIEMKAQMFGETEETYLVKEIDDLDIKSFTSFCSLFVRTYPKGIFFVCHDKERCHVVIARHASLEFKANEMFKTISEKFNLRGGGNPGMAQGGGQYQEGILDELKKIASSL